MSRLEGGHSICGRGPWQLVCEPGVFERTGGRDAPARIHGQHLGEQVVARVVQSQARVGDLGEHGAQLASV